MSHSIQCGKMGRSVQGRVVGGYQCGGGQWGVCVSAGRSVQGGVSAGRGEVSAREVSAGRSVQGGGQCRGEVSAGGRSVVSWEPPIFMLTSRSPTGLECKPLFIYFFFEILFEARLG